MIQSFGTVLTREEQYPCIANRIYTLSNSSLVLARRSVISRAMGCSRVSRILLCSFKNSAIKQDKTIALLE